MPVNRAPRNRAGNQPDEPDPERFATREEFGAALTTVRDRKGLTIRQLARALNIPVSTLGGYFAGTHLPVPNQSDRMARLLTACGIDDPRAVDRWMAAYLRLRRGSDAYLEPVQPSGQGIGFAGESGIPAVAPRPVAADPCDAHPPAADHDRARLRPIIVSLTPPLERLEGEPVLRGRDAALADLVGRVTGAAPAESPRVHVLHGLGGCGKSTLALAVAREAVAAGVRTWWLNASRVEYLEAGMRALAVDLGATAQQLEAGSLPDVVWQLLNGSDHPWLLVFDDVDDPPQVLALPSGAVTDGTGWVRPLRSPRGNVAVTTRDGGAAWGRPTPLWLRLLPVPLLSPADGAQVLLELDGPGAGSATQAQALSARLGGLPLALKLAGRYIASARLIPAAMADARVAADFGAYTRALDKGGFDLLAAEPAAHGAPSIRREHVSLEHTWELSLDLLAERELGPSRPLLYLFATLGRAPVPYSLLLSTGTLARTALVDGATTHLLWQCLRALAEMSLVDLGQDEESGIEVLTLHPLVRDMARRQPGYVGSIRAYLAAAVATLHALAGKADPKLPAQWARWRLLADHCAAPLDLMNGFGVEDPPSTRAAIDLLGLAARYYRASGQFERAEASYTAAIRAAERLLERDDPLNFMLSHGLARVYYDRGRLERAEQSFRRVLTARAARLGPDHPETLATRHYLARTLRGQRRFTEAAELFEETLRSRSRILGETHPHTLTSRNGVADLLRDLGRTREARDVYRQVLTQRGEVLGERHPATLVTRHYLAMTELGLGNAAAAEAELRTLIEINTEVRGAEHPRTLAVRQTLVEALRRLGRADEAESAARSLLAARERLLGEDHPATAATRRELDTLLFERAAESGDPRGL